MVYKMEQEVPSYLCNRADRLHPWAAVRLCQEVTEYHSNSLGAGFESLMEHNRAWVIVRSYYEFHRHARVFEKVMLNTWPRGNDGLFAFRDYRITTPTGEVLLTGTSYWTLIDYTQRRAVRLKDFINAYETTDELATNRASLGRLAMPEFTESDVVVQFTAQHSMIDHTQHVNNSEYIKWIFDALNLKGFDDSQAFSLELNFQHETKPGDNIAVAVKTVENGYYAQVTNSFGTSVNAYVQLL